MDKDQALKLTRGITSDIIGIAPNAFSRVVASEYFPNFSIICFKNRGETDYIAKDIEVLCIEKEYPREGIEKTNAREILRIPQVQDYISKKKDPRLLLYKPTKGVEAIADEKNWKLLANSWTVKYEIENKLAFREVLKKAGIEAITGETVLYDQLDENLFVKMLDRYGPKIVFQIAEMTAGGGTGTAFLENLSDFRKFKEKFDMKKDQFTAIENVNVTKFKEGVPSSIAACATKHGVLVGRIQSQVLDIPDVRILSEGSGLFCGHDFSYGSFGSDLQEQAKTIAKKFGMYIYNTMGYKGIFGIDLITNPEEGKVYPIECNPRFTDAFPVLSEMYSKNGIVPMDVFHILEHLGVEYDLDVSKMNDLYDKSVNVGSQILLETKTDDWTKVERDMKAGVWNFDGSEIKFVKEGYRFEHLENQNQFLLTEGVPFKGSIYKPGARILRVVFARSILEKAKELKGDIKLLIENIYEKIDLQKTEPAVVIQDFLGLKMCSITDPQYLSEAGKMGADVVDLIGTDERFGYVRPKKVRWWVVFSDKIKDPIDLIKSKRLRKHLNNWLNNLSKYDLRYEIKQNITQEEFTQWYDKFLTILSSKEKANIRITKSWLKEKKIKAKKTGAVFIYKGNTLLGGNLFIYGEESLLVGFGAVEKTDTPKWSLGAIVDFICVKHAMETGMKKVSFGIDTNLYGHHLSTGLLTYKLNFGLTPTYKETADLISTKFMNMNKFEDYICFLGIKDGKIVFYLIKTNDKSEPEKPILNTNLEVIEIV
ncbi:MAG TPA: ATP-grasp domain-containing protein [Patescibacteria group bacterium]|nr:ATP-grasp domain-containing protein [Patescibacteria group bacterium]